MNRSEQFLLRQHGWDISARLVPAHPASAGGASVVRWESEAGAAVSRRHALHTLHCPPLCPKPGLEHRSDGEHSHPADAARPASLSAAGSPSAPGHSGLGWGEEGGETLEVHHSETRSAGQVGKIQTLLCSQPGVNEISLINMLQYVNYWCIWTWHSSRR